MPSSNSLAPGFLIASPRLDNTPFERALILMIHHNAEGAMGLIVNKPLEHDFGSLLVVVEEEIEARLCRESYEVPVHFGGPVRLEQLWMIYEMGGLPMPNEPERLCDLDDLGVLGALRFHDRFVLAASWDIIERYATGERDGLHRPFIGYTGWGPGQIEEEIEEGSWLASDFDDQIAFGTNPQQAWSAALAQTGVNPTAFMMMSKMGSA